MAHRETNDNQEYDFVEDEGADDGPYVTDEGDPVLDDAALTVEGNTGDDAEDGGENVADGEDGMSDGDGAGFGAVAALLAILGSVFAARRIQ